MKIIRNIFKEKNNSRGNMLVELLLSIALASIVIPFVFRYQQDAVERAQNIAITNEMTEIQVALERYIMAHRTDLLGTVGRNITRVKLDDLAEFGVPETVLNNGRERYQLRILKSSDAGVGATLQGVIVRESADITPMRTREIVNLSGGSMGFVDGTHAYGTFGAWHTDAVDLGINMENALVETTNINRDGALYLWRVPSNGVGDATMMSPLNLGGHDIVNTKFLNANTVDFAEGLKALKIVSDSVIFQNRTTIDQAFTTINATVSGILSSDGRALDIKNTLSVADIAKLSVLTAENLWATNLTLSGLSIDALDDLAMLKVTQSLDMTGGHISALFVTVGFTGSITPRLVVYDRIEDSMTPDYYWDVNSKRAHLMDAQFVELNRMATLAYRRYGDKSTTAGQLFGAVSANKNATVADYMNVIREIQTRVRGKYRLLNLE